jgi:hypothetical protein
MLAADQVAGSLPRGLKPRFILGQLMYGLKPVPFKLAILELFGSLWNGLKQLCA